MLATFYQYSKRHNSTGQPTAAGKDMEVLLKDATSVLSPTLILKSADSSPYDLNYLYLMDFGRYYYISDWRYNRGVWECDCSEDLLASWKPEIKSSECFVEFSASQYNEKLMDNRIAATSGYDRQVNDAAFVGIGPNQTVVPKGTFGLTALSQGSEWGTGAATTYYMTYQQMQEFARKLLDPSVWESLKQFFTNPLDAVIDCFYLPLDISSYANLSADIEIKLGEYATGAFGKAPLATALAVKYFTATIPIPWRYEGFRRLPPYTEVTLFVPFCGTKTLPAELISDIDKIFVDYSVDYTTGNVQALAYVKNEVLEEFSGNCKVSLPIGQSQARAGQVLGGVAGAVSAIGNYAAGNPIAGTYGVINAISSLSMPQVQKVAGSFGGSVLGATMGSDISRWQKFRLICTSRDTAEEPEGIRPVQGNALAKTVSLSGLSGYVKTSGASVQAPAFDSEIQQVNMMLDSGIYLE